MTSIHTPSRHYGFLYALSDVIAVKSIVRRCNACTQDLSRDIHTAADLASHSRQAISPNIFIQDALISLCSSNALGQAFAGL